MISLLLWAALATGEVPAAPQQPPLKVLVLDLRADDVPDSTARIIRDEITVVMSRDERLDVMSSEDLRRVVTVEAEKNALGCSNDESCLAEIGQALGARYIVHGSVAVLGSSTIIHLTLVDTDAGRAVARETAETKTTDELLPLLRAALGRVRARMLGEAPPTPAPQAGLSGLATLGLVAGGAGVLGLAAGGAMMAAAWPAFANPAPPPEGPAPDEREAAQGLGQAGTLVLAAGAVVAAAGSALFALEVLP